MLPNIKMNPEKLIEKKEIEEDDEWLEEDLYGKDYGAGKLSRYFLNTGCWKI
ncbi:MAG: hypothetical protein KJ718_02195 [Nanoarchaeota archaeon]|nr:hypothetical protein [Nanoarchaeota archaeon]MBU1051345.1 hypothetical protein [Nanoarchaeota archaeon]MBU1987945.1 hypothetical protein [Nanoarchaeota archaeon]